MNNEHMDATFRELQAELTVTPSPEFAAKVRARIAQHPARRWFGAWHIATATVALAGVVLAVAVWPRATGSPEVEPTLDVSAVGHAPAAVASAAVPASPIDRAPSSAVAQSPRRVVTRVARTMPSRETEVLVPSDQRIALAQLLGAMRNRGTEVPALVAGEVDSEGRLPAPPAISVAPITITPLGPPVPGGGSRER